MIKSKQIKEKAKEKDAIWPIEEQTKIKHQLLRSYITQWIAILYQQQKRIGAGRKLVYVDGFAGPGVYWRDKLANALVLGSPLIVAKEANKAIRKDISNEFVIICLDKNKNAIDILNLYLELFNKYKQNWKGHIAEFDPAINSLFDELEQSGSSNAPIFFFIDPFGYSGFPITTLKRILKYPLVELFINFDVYDVERFCHDINKDENMIQLFGCEDFREVRKSYRPNEKYTFLRNLYCKQLKIAARAKYIMPFRVNTPKQRNRPRYYLIHASNHIKALRVMKDSMAKLSDSPYAFEAIGGSNIQMGLFEDPEKLNLKSQIQTYIKANTPNSILYEILEEWAYINTNGISSKIKEILCELEKIDKYISIERKPKQQKTTVVKGAKIKYIIN